MLKLSKTEAKQYKTDIAKANASAKKNAREQNSIKYSQTVKEEKPSEAPLCIEFRAKRLERVAKRMAFKVRYESTLPEGVKHREHISPLLNLNSQSQFLTQSEKAEACLYEYSKRHRCPHKLSWNKYDIHHNWVLPKCDHLFENPNFTPLDSADTNTTCCKCGSKLSRVERMCEHEGRNCPRCKINFYRLEDRWATVACDCNMLDVLTTVRDNSNNPSLSIVAPSWQAFYDAQQSIVKTWLDKHLRWKIRHQAQQEEIHEKRRVNAQKTFASLFSEQPREVVHEGIGMSSLVTAKDSAFNFFKKMIEQVSKVALFVKDLLHIEGLDRLLDLVGVALGLLEATLTIFAELPITEAYLLVRLIQKGSWLDYIVMTFHLLYKYSKTMELDNFLEHSTVADIVTSPRTKIIYNCFRDGMLKLFPSKPIGPLRSDEPVHFTKNLVNLVRANREEEDDKPQFRSRSKTERDPFTGERIVEQEGGFDLLTALVNVLPSTHAMPLFKTLSLFAKDILPILNVTKTITQLGSSIYQWLRKVLGYWTVKTNDWLANEITDATSLLNELVGAAADFKAKSYLSDPNTATARALLVELTAKAVNYLKENGRYDTVGIRFISDIDRILAAPVAPASRAHEPFCVRIYGAAGTGKSKNVPLLFGPIFGCKNKAEFDALCFTRGTSEYWDGAAGRPIIYYDDFGQNISTEVDLIELIALVSASPFMPNFATLSGPGSKGVSLDPKIVVCCSNIKEDNSKHLLEREALTRRFHLTIYTEARMVGGVAHTHFRCTGGSLVREALVPVSKALEPAVMADFIYGAYAAFLKSRRAGTMNNDAQMTSLAETHPALLWKRVDTVVETQTYPQHHLGKYAERPDIVKTLEQPNINIVPAPRMQVKTLPMTIHPRSQLINTDDDEIPLDQEGFSWRYFYSTTYELSEGVAAVAWAFIGTTVAYDVTRWIYYGAEINAKKTITLLLTGLATTIAAGIIACYSYRKFLKEDEVESSARKPRNHVPVVQEGLQCVVEDQKILERAACRIERLNSDGSTYYGVNGLFVGGHYLLTVEHIFVPTVGSDEWIPEGSKLNIIATNGSTQIISFNSKRIKQIYRQHDDQRVYIDACLYELPADIFPARRSILKKFWEGGELLSKIPAAMLDRVSSTTLIWKESVVHGQRASIYSQSCKTWRQILAYGTHASQPGSCGAVAMRSDGISNSPILGIHVARDPVEDRPMILLISRAMLERAMTPTLDPPLLTDERYFVEPQGLSESEQAFLQGNLFLVGRMARPVYGPTKTQLIRSPLYNEVTPSTTEPSILSNKDPRLPEAYKKEDFLLRCTEKLRSHVDISEFDLDEASSELCEFYSTLKTTAPKFLTLKQAISGDQYINSLDLSTSPGFPGVVNNLRKTSYFERREQILYPTSLFYSELYNDLLAIKEQRCPDWLSIGNLKDERRPIAKVRVTPKTRLFAVCSQNHNILQKIYYGPFMWRCMENMFKVPYSGGIDRLGASWHTLIESLLECSTLGFGGDYECFDGRFSYTLMKHGLKVMSGNQFLDIPFYLDRDYALDIPSKVWIDRINSLELSHSLVKQAVDQSILNPIYVFRSILLMVAGTVASGLWVTQLLDSVGNELMFLCGWNYLVPLQFHGHPNFRSLTRLYVMGDDNIIAVAQEVLPYFNGETFADWLKERNMIYTSADKNGRAKKYQEITTISYLKNTTTQLKHMHAPLMEYDAAVEPINWIRKSSEDAETLCEQNCSGVLRALFFHGPGVFNQIRSRILGLKPLYKLPSYNTLKLQYLAYGYFPGFCPEKDYFQDSYFPALEEDKYRRDIPEGCADKPRPTTPVSSDDIGEDVPPVIFETEESDEDWYDELYNELMEETEFVINPDLTDEETRMTVREQEDFTALYNTMHPEDPIFGSITREMVARFVDTLRLLNASNTRETLHLEYFLPDYQYFLSALQYCYEGPGAYDWLMTMTHDTTSFEITDDFTISFKKHWSAVEYRPVNPQGIERFNCPVCSEYFYCVNRLGDHMCSAHTDEETWKSQTTVNDMIAKAPVVQWRRWYTELNTALSGGQHSDFVRQVLRDNYKLSDVYSTLNWLINQVKNKTFVDVPKGVACSPAWNITAIIKGGAAPKIDAASSEPSEVDKILNELVTKLKPRLDPYLQYRNMIPEMDMNVGKAAVDPVASTVTPSETRAKSKADIGDPTSEVAETVNSHGYVHSDKLQTTVVTVQRGMGARSTANRAELSMNDVAWDLEKMLEKYGEFASVPWKITDATTTQLAKFDVVADLVKTAFAGSPFGAFNNFRAASVNIRIVLAASKFHQGRVVVGFIPKMLNKDAPNYALEQTVVTYHPINAPRLIELGAVIMDPAQGGTAYLNIPFVHPKGFLNLLQNDSLGQLYVVVLSQLNASTGASTEVRVKLSFSLDKPEFKIPRASPLTFQQYRMIEQQAEKLTNVLVPPSYRRVRQEAGDLGAKKTLTAQKDIHEAFREAVPIAPVRALTSDPTHVPHFGEHDDDLMNWGKRYRKIVAWDDTFTPPATKWFTLSLANILDEFWFMWCFAAYRGRLRFKIFFSTNIDNSSATSGNGFARFWWAQAEQATKMQNILVRDDTPSVRISSGQCAEFETPFLNQTGIALNPIIYANTETNQNTNTFMSDYQLYINVGSTSNVITRVKLEVYASLADEFQPGVFISPPYLMVNKSFPGYFTFPSAKEEEDRWVIQQGLPDLLDKGLSKIAEKIIPEDVVGTVLETLLDKPAVCDPPIWVVPKQGGFLNFSTQPEPMDKLQLHPGSQQLVDSEHFSTPVSECKLKTWFNRKSLLGSFTWKTTTAAEELITSMQVGPMFELPIDFGANNTANPTIMSFVASNYTYWRGGITYIFDVVTSAFHEGRLDVTFHPNTDVVPTDYNTRVSQYTVSVPVKNTENTFAITVPYLGETPWKRVWDGRATNTPDGSSSPPSIANYSTGIIGVSVSAPLRVPDGISPEVEVLMYVLPAEDFQLAEKTPNCSCLIPRPYF